MKKNNVRKNYIYNVMYQIVAIIIPIITTPYVSRVLGANNIGIYGYTVSISAYFILFGSLGISLYGQREIAYCQGDSKKYSKSFYEILLLRFIAMTISAILFYFIFVFKSNDYSIYFKILLVEIIANMFDISWFLQGLEEFKKTVVRNIIVRIISLVVIFLFVKSKSDLPIYFIIYVLSILIGNLSLWLYLPKYLKKIKIKELNMTKHLKPALVLFVPQIAIQVYTVLDRTMIGILIPAKEEVGFYTQGEHILKLLLGTVMLPRIASIFSTGDKEKIKEYLNKSFNFVYFLGMPMVFGIISVSRKFVPVFFGSGYDRVIYVMMTISPILIFIGLSNVLGVQYLLPTKRQKEFTISVFVGAIINFGINLILIPKYGAIGAAIGTIIAELFVTIVQLFYVRKDLNVLKILKISITYFIGSITMFVALLFVRKIPLSNLESVLLQVLVGIVVYILYLIITKNEFVFEYYNQFKGIIKSKSKLRSLTIRSQVLFFYV